MGYARAWMRATPARPSARTVSQYFHRWTGRHRWVDKNNQNGLCVPYLHALFPDAVFVYVKRSPGDNLNSLIEGWGKPDEFATWSADLPAEVAVDGGRYRRWCFFLAEGWRKYTHAPIEAVAEHFNTTRSTVRFSTLARPLPRRNGSRCCLEDFLRDPVTTFRRVFEGCGLQLPLAARTALRAGARYSVQRVFRDSSGQMEGWAQPRARRSTGRCRRLPTLASRMGYAAG